MVNKKTMAETKDKPVSKAQKAKELKQKYDALIAEAKDELLETVNGAITELAELGYAYTLIPTAELDSLKARQSAKTGQGAAKTAGTGKSSPKPAPGPSANYDEGKVCSFCSGAKGHDGRAHRNQEPKRAFTAEELAARGLQAPDAAGATA